MHPIFHRIINRRNILLLCAVIVVGFAFWYFQSLQELYGSLADIFARLARYNEILAGAVFVFLSVIAAMVSFFTSTPLVPAATQLWGKNITFLLLLGSWVLGGVLAYYIAYHSQKLVRRFGIYKKAQEHLQHLEGRSEMPLILLFRLAAPSELGAYTLGLLRYKFWRYFLTTVLSELPFALLAIYSTDALVSRRPFLFITEIALGIIFIGTMLYFFHKRLNEHENH